MASKILSKYRFGEVDAEANEILKRELKEKWDEKPYREIRLEPNLYGFMSSYLFLSVSLKQFSSSAKISILLELAKLDLQKGSSIAELVYSCCKFFPKKEAIESLIELGKQSESEEKVVESVFNFENHLGFNVLIGLFAMANKCRHLKYSSDELICNIEESYRYLIKLAKSAKSFDKIINHTTKNGSTFFLCASIYSEEITRHLLEEKVAKINSITDLFVTPYFKVRLKIYF